MNGARQRDRTLGGMPGSATWANFHGPGGEKNLATHRTNRVTRAEIGAPTVARRAWRAHAAVDLGAKMRYASIRGYPAHFGAFPGRGLPGADRESDWLQLDARDHDGGRRFDRRGFDELRQFRDVDE